MTYLNTFGTTATLYFGDEARDVVQNVPRQLVFVVVEFLLTAFRPGCTVRWRLDGHGGSALNPLARMRIVHAVSLGFLVVLHPQSRSSQASLPSSLV